MSYTTQCPSCQTRFKVTDQHLSAANGRVRCGRCSHVFNATEHFVSIAPASPPPQPVPATPPPRPAPSASVAAAPRAPADPMDDFELELPDFDPQSAASPAPAQDFPLEIPAAEPVAEAASQSSSEAEEFQRALAEALHSRSSPPSAPSYASPPDEPEDNLSLPEVFGRQHRRIEPTDSPVTAPNPAPSAPEISTPAPQYQAVDENSSTDDAAADDSRPVRKPWLTMLLALLSVCGIVLLAAQLVYFNRTRIAVEVPEARPALEAFCGIAGCKVPWPSDIGQIRTEWSELAFVPEHANLIQLSATLKNHAGFAQNYPMLEVSLKDADDQVLIRKVFAPKEYLKPDDFKLQRFNANSEVKVTMRLDIGKARAMGYSLYWFYP